jgi:antigen 43
MVQTSFSVSNATTLATVLQEISSGGTDAAIDTSYTIALTAGIFAASETLDLDANSSATLDATTPFIIDAFTVTGTLVTDLNFTGTITLDNGVLENPAVTSTGGTVIAGRYSGSVLGTSGDAGDIVINNGSITTGGADYAIELGAGTVQNGWNGPSSALVSGVTGGVAVASGLVQNGGTIDATGTGAPGVYLATGTVDNGQIGATTALISGAENGVVIAGAGTVDNDGTVIGIASDAVYLVSGGVTNGQLGDATALIAGGSLDNGVWIESGVGTVANFGTITGGGAAGVFLEGGGTVTNGAAADTAALIAGALEGVLLEGAGSLLNYGTVLANGSNGTLSVTGAFLSAGGTVENLAGAAAIDGEQWGVLVEGAAGFASNPGSIEASASNGLGVDFFDGGTIVNGLTAGSSALISGGYDGVRISADAPGGGADVQNDGTIVGGVGVDFATGATAAAGTLINDGLIESTAGSTGYAVLFGQGTERLVLQSAGTIVGNVLGGEAAGSSTTLELAAGTQGTLSNLGGNSGTVTDAAGSFGFSAIGTLVLDAGASWIVDGPGTLATVSNAGALSLSGGAVTVTGSLTNTGGLTIGGDTLTATAGLLTDGGVITVGAGGLLKANGASITVGNIASSELDIGAGGTVTAAVVDAAAQSGSSGIISVTGTGAALITTGSFVVGSDGAGELSVLNGATVHVGGALEVGQLATGSGNVDIEDASLSVAGNLDLGLGGNAGVLTVGTGATLTVNGGLIGGPDSELNEFGDPTSLFDDGVNTNVGVSETQDYLGYVDDFAKITIDAGVTLTLETPSIYNKVSLALGRDQDTTGDMLVLNAGSVSANSKVVFDNQLGTLVLGINSLPTIDIQANDAAASTLVANPDLGIPTIDQFQATIDSFETGDTIIVDTTAAATFSENGAVISVIQNGTSIGALNFDNTPDAQTAYTTAGALVDNVICFCAGTLITTPDGEVPVERISVGDVVLTARGVARRVVWVGSGKVMVARGRRSAATPVIVRKGALAENVPHHDLHVTKGHSFYLDDVLIPVEFLINHRTILWNDRAQEVTIYHVELETHDVLLANGAPAESYRDDGNRWLFHNGNSGWDQPAKPPCARVLTGGPLVDAVWRRLLDRVGPRPHVPLTDDPDLHVLADGRRLDIATRAGEVVVFNLPRTPVDTRLVSLAAAPQELGLARDPRFLGVALRRIIVRQGARFRVIEADDARLSSGFHAFEAASGLRWTDGDAVLPADLFHGFAGATELVLHLAGTAQYVDTGAAHDAATARAGLHCAVA